MVTIIGPSGSGKTTLLRCVNFLETYDGGSIRIDGEEVGYRDVQTRRRRPERELARMRAETGMVFQMFNLFPHLTAAQNVMLGLTKVRGKSKAEAREIAAHWLARVGLAEKLDSLPAELSGGQQQRVGIARAVAMDPKILLLDEITSALDPELVGEVLDVVLALAKEGMTMLVVTHEIAFSRDISDKVVFMADGVVSAEGRPGAALRAGLPQCAAAGLPRAFQGSADLAGLTGSMTHFIGIDVGTSAVKIVLVDGAQTVLAEHEAPLAISRPKPDWSEQDPDAWWDATAALLDRLARDEPAAMSGVGAIGLSGQMHGAVLLGEDDRPLRPAMLWNDGRAAAEALALRTSHPDLPAHRRRAADGGLHRPQDALAGQARARHPAAPAHRDAAQGLRAPDADGREGHRHVGRRRHLVARRGPPRMEPRGRRGHRPAFRRAAAHPRKCCSGRHAAAGTGGALGLAAARRRRGRCGRRGRRSHRHRRDFATATPSCPSARRASSS